MTKENSWSAWEEGVLSLWETPLKSGEQIPLLEKILKALDEGQLRVAYPTSKGWKILSWVHKAILLCFKTQPLKEEKLGPFTYHDKWALKENFSNLGVRVVPPAAARYGSFMEEGVVLMPSYVNVGAYVGKGSMVDTWATVGSCAQIGAGVHLSGGVGIGGVLEPPGARPVIVEDGAFIGSRCILVEGVHIGKEAVLGANTTLTASTPLVDLREGREGQILKGQVPSRSVVVPGTMAARVRGVSVHKACAYILGERKASTDKKTSLNQALRDFDLSL